MFINQGIGFIIQFTCVMQTNSLSLGLVTGRTFIATGILHIGPVLYMYVYEVVNTNLHIDIDKFGNCC